MTSHERSEPHGRGELLSVADTVERELQAAVEGVLGQARMLAEGATQLAATASSLRDLTTAAADAIVVASQNIQTVAGAATELDAASGAIAGQVERSSSLADSAVDQAKATEQSVQALVSATDRINGVVKLITKIAGQTKLLALNATIEAARAGDMGKGFAVVATEVKSLARQTEDAIQSVSAEASAIGGATTDAAAKVGRIAEHIGAVSSASEEASNAVQQQRAATGEIMRSAADASRQTQTIASSTDALLREAGAVSDSAVHLNEIVGLMNRGITDLHRRVTVILRNSTIGDRRHQDREPISLPFTLEIGRDRITGHTGDLSPHGALLLVSEGAALVGKPGRLTLEGVGALPCTTAGFSPLGLHLAFDTLSAEQHERVGAVLDDTRRADGRLIARAQAVGVQIERAMDDALAARRISIDELFDTLYREIPDTNPKQFLTRNADFADTDLAPILDRAKESDPSFVFCIVCDTNGYLPTHNREYRQKQRPGDPTWNTAHCRNRRIFDDRTGLLAAHNQKPHLIQSYRRDMGGGNFAVLKEFNVPVTVSDRRWGSVRLAVRL